MDHKQSLPSWLTVKLGETAPAPSDPGAGKWGELVALGQIRRLDPMDRGPAMPRLVLVTGTGGLAGTVTVSLLSPEVEMAADQDVFLPGELSALPYDLLVLTAVTGPAWLVQLAAPLATVDLDEVSAGSVGTPLRDELDARWDWQESELAALIELTGECRREVLDGEPLTLIDPAALDQDHINGRDILLVAEETSTLLKKGNGYVSVTQLGEFLDAARVPASKNYEAARLLTHLLPRYPGRLLYPTHPTGTSQPGQTTREAGAKDGAAPESPQESHIGAVAEAGALAQEQPVRAVADDSLPAALDAILAEQRIDRCVHVVSLSGLWKHPTEGPTSLASEAGKVRDGSLVELAPGVFGVESAKYGFAQIVVTELDRCESGTPQVDRPEPGELGARGPLK